MTSGSLLDRYVAFDHCRHRLPCFTWANTRGMCADLHRLALELSRPGSATAPAWQCALASLVYVLAGLRQILRSFRRCAAAARTIHLVPYRRQLRGLAHVAFRRNAASDAYYTHRLFRPGDLARTDLFLEHRELQLLLRALYRDLDTDALADKLRFAGFCREHHLPTPPLWGAFRDGGPLPGCDTRWLEDPKSDVFVKPAADYSGHGIERWCYCAETKSYAHGDRMLSHAALTAEILNRTGEGRTLLVQPRLHEGPELAELTSGSVCNYRILTGCAPDAEPVVLTAVVRLPSAGHYLTDIGNDILAAPVDLATGRLGSAQAKDIARGVHSRHPTTGAPIEDRIVSTWPEIAALARRAHAACRWMPFVGWDVVDTTEGPVLLEANAYWGGNLCQMSGHRFLGETDFPAIYLAHLAKLRPELVPLLQN